MKTVLTKLTRFTYSLFLILLCFSAPLRAQDIFTPQPYIVTMQLQTEGLDAGKMQFSLQKNGNTWLAESTFTPSLIAKVFGLDELTERTKFLFINSSYIPFQYYSDSNNILFDYDKSVYYNIKSRHKLGDIPALAQTSQSMLTVMAHDSVAKRSNTHYSVFSNEKFSRHNLRFDYNQTVTIDEQAFSTTKATLSKGNKRTIFWLAKKWNWIPIKMEKYKKDNLVLTGTLDTIEYNRPDAN